VFKLKQPKLVRALVIKGDLGVAYTRYDLVQQDQGINGQGRRWSERSLDQRQDRYTRIREWFSERVRSIAVLTSTIQRTSLEACTKKDRGFKY